MKLARLGIMALGLSTVLASVGAVVKFANNRPPELEKLLLGLTTAAPADDNDDTLKFYLSKSDLVVIGTITSKPHGWQWELGVVHYICDFKIDEVLKGKEQVEGEIRVCIVRFESDDDDRAPELKEGGKCILFLKDLGGNNKPAWQTTDAWFGIQRASPQMAESLKRLAKEEEKD